MRDALALVLAGGRGESLSVLTAERAVSAVPFGGKYRVVDFVLSNCCHAEIGRVAVVTQHAPASLHDHIGSGRWWDLDRRDTRVLLLQPYLTREESASYRGTADAIAQNWDIVQGTRVARVLVLPGDHVYKMDYRALFRSHVDRGADVTLAVTPVAAEEAPRFGMVAVDDRERVIDLEEKPATTRSRLASMGVALFEAGVLGEALARDPVDLTVDVLRPLIAAGARVQAHTFAGYWEDVGTLGAYHRASLDLLGPASRLALEDPQWPILTRDEERPPVRVEPGAVIEESLVANGCRVAGRVRHSVLFPGVVVDAGAEIVDSVVFQDTRIGREARLERAVLDKLVGIGAGAVVGAKDGPLTLVGKSALVPDGSRVGAGAILGLAAGPADFHDGLVPPGTRVPDRDPMRSRR